MRRIVSGVLVLVLSLGFFGGCSSSRDEEPVKIANPFGKDSKNARQPPAGVKSDPKKSGQKPPKDR
jgi:hypothetical protein